MSASHINFFVHLEENQAQHTSIEKMEAAFDLENYTEAYEYGQLALKEIELDRKYYVHNRQNVHNITTDAIRLKEKKALEFRADIIRDDLLSITSSDPTPHLSFFKETASVGSPVEHTPAKKMEAAFNSGNYAEAYDYCQLTLEEVELDRKYYIQDRCYVPSAITDAVNLNAGKALTLLGDIYRDGLLDNIQKNIETAECYYLKAIDDVDHLEAAEHLRVLKESEEYASSLNTVGSNFMDLKI